MTHTPYKPGNFRKDFQRSSLIPSPPSKTMPSLPPGVESAPEEQISEAHLSPNHSPLPPSYPVTQKKAIASELASLMTGINQMTDQLHNLLAKQETVAEQAQILSEITSHIRETLQPAKIFTTAVEDIREVLGADRVVVYLFDQNWDGTVVAESVGTGWTAALGAELTDPCFRMRYIEPYQKGRVRAIANIYEEGLTECHITQLETFQVQANLVAPILANQKLHGLLIAHQCEQPRTWQEWEIDLFKQLAIQVGYAIDQAFLLEKQAQTANLAQRLNSVTSHIREFLNIEDIFTVAVEDVRDILEVDRTVVYKFDGNWNGTIVAEAVGSGWTATLGKTITDPCFKDRYIKAYQRGRVQAIANIHEADLTECYLQQLEPYQVKASIVAPILVNQKLYGLLIGHQCDQTRQWQESEIEFFKQVGVQIGFALDQAIVLEKQQATAQRAQLLNQITSRIRESLNPKDIFGTAVEDAQEILQVERVVVCQLNEEREGKIISEAVSGAYKSCLGVVIPGNCCVQERSAKQYQKGRISAIANLREAGLTLQHIAELEAYQIKAQLVAPIIANQQLYGLLIAHQCSGPRHWEETDIDFFKQVAIQVGFAIDQAILLEKQQAAVKQAQRLNEITSHIRQSLKPEDIFTAAVEDAQESYKLSE